MLERCAFGEAEFVTRNNRVWLAHNQLGFRDIEHDESSSEKPAIAFLGDSFTWGYEVEFEEMFVNRLRGRFPGYDVYNLAHRGYGTDQAYLAFKNWETERPVALVVLMFSENDVGDNSTDFNYAKPKPKFVVEQDELILTGVPVPRCPGRRPGNDRQKTSPWNPRGIGSTTLFTGRTWSTTSASALSCCDKDGVPAKSKRLPAPLTGRMNRPRKDGRQTSC